MSRSDKSSRAGKMSFRRTIRYYWLKFKRLQDTPRKLAGGMALGVFIGVTPTVPFHTIMVLFLAPLLRVSPVTAVMGICVMNPVTMAPMYYAAYQVGKLIIFRQVPLNFPEAVNFHALFDLLWRGGLALQLGGVIIALPPAIISYFLTLWVVKRLRRAKNQVRESECVPPVSQNSSSAPGPEA